MPDAPTYIEFLVQYATSAVASDASASLWINGSLQETLTNFDLFDYAMPDTMLIGTIYGLDAGTSGAFYLDEIVLRADAIEIGA